MSGWDSWGATPTTGAEAVTTAPGWENNTPHQHVSRTEPHSTPAYALAPLPVQQAVPRKQEAPYQAENQAITVSNSTAGQWGAPTVAPSMPPASMQSSGQPSPIAAMSSNPPASTFGNGGADSGWASANPPASPITSVSRNGFSPNQAPYNSASNNGYASSQAGGYSPQTPYDSERPRPPRTEPDVVISPPTSLKGHIIGAGRCNLNEFQEKSQANIFLVLRPGAEDPLKDKDIGIAGNAEQVEEAIKLIVMKGRERARDWIPDGKAGEIVQKMVKEGKLEVGPSSVSAQNGYGSGPILPANSTGSWSNTNDGSNVNERPITYREAVPMPPPSFIGSSVTQRNNPAPSIVSQIPSQVPASGPMQPTLSAQANAFIPPSREERVPSSVVSHNQQSIVTSIRSITPPARTVGWGNPDANPAPTQNGNSWNGWDANAPPPPRVENNFPTSTMSNVGSRAGGVTASSIPQRTNEGGHSRQVSEEFAYPGSQGTSQVASRNTMSRPQQAAIEVSQAFQQQNRGFENAQPAHPAPASSGPPGPTGWISAPSTIAQAPGSATIDLKEHGRNATQDSGYVESQSASSRPLTTINNVPSPTQPTPTTSGWGDVDQVTSQMGATAIKNGERVHPPSAGSGWAGPASSNNNTHQQTQQTVSSPNPAVPDGGWGAPTPASIPNVSMPGNLHHQSPPPPSSVAAPATNNGWQAPTSSPTSATVQPSQASNFIVNSWAASTSIPPQQSVQNAASSLNVDPAPTSNASGWGAPAAPLTPTQQAFQAPTPPTQANIPASTANGWGVPSAPAEQPPSQAPLQSTAGGWGAPAPSTPTQQAHQPSQPAAPAVSNGWEAPSATIALGEQDGYNSHQQPSPPPAPQQNGWNAAPPVQNGGGGQNGYAGSQSGGGYGNNGGSGGYSSGEINGNSYGQGRPSNGFGGNGFGGGGYNSGGGGGNPGGYGPGFVTGCNAVPLRNNRWGKPSASDRQQENGYGQAQGPGNSSQHQNGYGSQDGGNGQNNGYNQAPQPQQQQQYNHGW